MEKLNKVINWLENQDSYLIKDLLAITFIIVIDFSEKAQSDKIEIILTYLLIFYGNEVLKYIRRDTKQGLIITVTSPDCTIEKVTEETITNTNNQTN